MSEDRDAIWASRSDLTAPIRTAIQRLLLQDFWEWPAANAASAALEVLEATLEAAERKNGKFREALREIAETGGWETVWTVDEAEPEQGKQPTITNQAAAIALAALDEGDAT